LAVSEAGLRSAQLSLGPMSQQSQKSTDSAFKSASLDDHHLPTLTAKRGDVSFVAGHIPVDLGIPVVGVRGWPNTVSAIVAMPETSIDEDHN
jgi:hypothetical protein